MKRVDTSVLVFSLSFHRHPHICIPCNSRFICCSKNKKIIISHVQQFRSSDIVNQLPLPPCGVSPITHSKLSSINLVSIRHPHICTPFISHLSVFHHNKKIIFLTIALSIVQNKQSVQTTSVQDLNPRPLPDNTFASGLLRFSQSYQVSNK